MGSIGIRDYYYLYIIRRECYTRAAPSQGFSLGIHFIVGVYGAGVVVSVGHAPRRLLCWSMAKVSLGIAMSHWPGVDTASVWVFLHRGSRLW